MRVTEQQVQRQLELEEQYIQKSLSESKRQILEAIKGGRAADLMPVQRLTGAAFNTVCTAIDELKKQKAAGVGGKYLKHIRGVKTDILAAASLSICFNSLHLETYSNKTSAQAVMAKLGSMVQSELLNNQLKKVAPAYMNRVHEYLKERNTTSQTHIMRTLRASANAIKMGYEPWDNTECIGTGKHLMEAVYSTGLFKWGAGDGGTYALEPADCILNVLADFITQAQFIRITPPMLVPPTPHTDIFDGGYLDERTDTRGTYKHKNITKAQLRAVNAAFKKADKLRAVLNKAQEVPYQVNKYILNMVHTARALGVGIGMPSTKAAPKPEWYLDGIPKEQYSERELDDFEQWKMQTVMWHESERKRLQDIKRTHDTIEQCEEFKHEQALYFPTYVDWRYRLYFKSRLNPQGDDLTKGLLVFARKKPLGERGLFWLKVHAATSFGYDKKRFKYRAQWFDENEHLIREMLKDPLNSPVFEKAGSESPWCFLAACKEAIDAIDSGNPEEFLSNIPVAMDATNSGAQHYAALRRDVVAGRLVNLFSTGDDEKADLYMDVVDRVNSRLIMDTDNPETLVQSRYWQVNPITRSMSKRPTMTYTYSATDQSRTKYLFQGARDEGYTELPEYSLFKLCLYLTPLVRDSIAEANPKAAEAMEYMREIVRRMPDDVPLQWTTPLGGLVINQYANITAHSVHIQSMGMSRLMAYNKDCSSTNKRKAQAGVAPNGIHSNDATHLGMIILEHSGDIMPIHDSVATHACDVDSMHKVIREQFVKLYTEHDLLKSMAESAESLGADLSDLTEPEFGTLNLELVKNSEFFFC